MTCEWFVVSVDELQIPRVVSRGHPNETVCDEQADNYCEKYSDMGEEIVVACEHHPLTLAALEHSVE